MADGGVLVEAARSCTAWCSSRIWLPLVGAAGSDDGSVDSSLRGRRCGVVGLVFWDPLPRAPCRCVAVSSGVGVGLLRYVCWRAPGSSSPSSAGEGAELVVLLLSSSSSCWFGATENYDFPSVFRSPTSRSSCALGGSSDGDAAAARPGSASEVQDGGLLRDLFVIFKFVEVVMYYHVC